MELIETNSDHYSAVFKSPHHFFNLAEFGNLNRLKCDEVKYLIFKDGRNCLGLVAGIRNNKLISPFSAPFGGLSFLESKIKIKYIEDAIGHLENYCILNGFSGIRLTLPPLFYSETFNAKLINVLCRARYEILYADIDFYLDLKLAGKYEDILWNNARKNLNLSLTSDLSFTIYDEIDKQKEAYEIIKSNRHFKGFPMNMSFDEILATSNIIKTDFFICSQGDKSIAAAIVYHISERSVYIPFWGDNETYRDLKPMNYIAFKIFEYYQNLEKHFVHLGIGTEDGFPNSGLCEFKESIGCIATPKFTFSKTF